MGAGERRVEVPSSDRQLAGFVVDQALNPVPGATVVVADRVDERCSAVTDSGGRISCLYLPDGEYVVWARHDDVGVSSPMRLPGTQNEVEPLVLKAGRTLAGKVVKGDEPKADARVGFGCPSYPHLVKSARTGADGRFEFVQVPREPGVLVGRTARRGDGTALFMRPVAEREQVFVGEFEVEPAGVAVATGPATGLKPGFHTAASLVVDGEEIPPWLFFQTATAGPHPVAPGLPGAIFRLQPGRYHLRWRDADGEVVAESAPFVVRADEVTVFSSRAR